MIQRSEMTKNHQGIQREVQDKTVRMYATNTTMCPVKSLRLYLDKRNQKCDAFFQKPRDSYLQEDSCWYEKRPLGKNKLGQMMSELSKFANLSEMYTNHCIRATAITALSNAGFEARQIMTISGHRNESSVRSYVQDTTSDQKRSMSASLSKLVQVKEHAEELWDEEDDFLCLSASQTEKFLVDITNFESSSSVNLGTVKNSTNEVGGNEHTPGCSVQIAQNASSSKNALSCIRSETVSNVNIAATNQPAPVFNFHGCNVQIYHN